jgi:hypothetical protein
MAIAKAITTKEEASHLESTCRADSSDCISVFNSSWSTRFLPIAPESPKCEEQLT